MTEQVWVLDDDSSIRWVLEKSLKSANLSSASFAAAESLWDALEMAEPKVIVSDIRMPGTDGLTLLERLQSTTRIFPLLL